MEGAERGLVSRQLAALAAGLAADPAGPGSAAAWAEAGRALAATETAEPDLLAAVQARDLAALRAIVADWEAQKRHLPEHDRTLLKRALKAFRKSLKVTRLDAESSIGGGPMSSGRQSSILGLRPPERYPRTVWDELARQGRLVAGKHGLFELPPE